MSLLLIKFITKLQVTTFVPVLLLRIMVWKYCKALIWTFISSPRGLKQKILRKVLPKNQNTFLKISIFKYNKLENSLFKREITH